MAATVRRTLPRDGAVVLGEVTTALLNLSVPLSSEETEKALRFVPGRPVEVRDHPRPRAVSSEVVVGVDCGLAHGASGPVRGIGSVTTRAVLTGGHVLQASARATVRVVESGRRHGWGHYTAQPGVIEVVDAARPEDLIDGFLAAGSPDGRSLNLSAVTENVRRRIGHDPAKPGHGLKIHQTSLRWAVRLIGGVAVVDVEYRPGLSGAWWIKVSANPEEIPTVTEFCEDVALHLWLLEALYTACDRSLRNPDAMRELKPALNYLGHLWMPPVNSEFRRPWQQLEDTVGVGREWAVLKDRVRDRINAPELTT